MPSWRRRSEPPAQDDAAALRAAIALLVQRREAARTAAGQALIGQVHVRQAVEQQRRELRAASDQLDDAIALARRVADRVEAEDGALEAGGYRANVTGLERQLDVVRAAAEQIEAIDDSSQVHVAAAIEVLRRSQALFADALREHLAALVAIERAERARMIRDARARWDRER